MVQVAEFCQDLPRKKSLSAIIWLTVLVRIMLIVSIVQICQEYKLLPATIWNIKVIVNSFDLELNYITFAMNTLHPPAQSTPSASSHPLPTQATLFEADESDISESDAEFFDIPLEDDPDYQESLNTTVNMFTHPTSSHSSIQNHGITLPALPARDCEEQELLQDSEEGVLILQSNSTEKKKKKKKKRKSHESKQKSEERHQGYKKAKTEAAKKEAFKHQVPKGANLYALIRRAKGRQPTPYFEHSIQDIYTNYRTFSLDEVQHGIIIRDSRQRPLVHLFPPETISTELIQTLASSLEEYDNSVSFPNYDYTHRRGDYQVHILGCWFKSGRFLKPYMTAHYRGPQSGIHYKRLDNSYYIAVKKFQKANYSLFQLVEDLI
ncbi:hypothetical protein B9Z19DRAFT_1067992 [Tuber borchii]|uniref:Uncharacterized protein n=1 Tax=Tuber borchii TaxID=42251 RepID=A0A2T6ZGY6_TUBBO|nr:hypothetical protein B9Z19DRAFT_1067992 [Tuber borchii]